MSDLSVRNEETISGSNPLIVTISEIPMRVPNVIVIVGVHSGNVVGLSEGVVLGIFVGVIEGLDDGFSLGKEDGLSEGDTDGFSEGDRDGSVVGPQVRISLDVIDSLFQ